MVVVAGAEGLLHLAVVVVVIVVAVFWTDDTTDGGGGTSSCHRTVLTRGRTDSRADPNGAVCGATSEQKRESA